MGLILVYWGIFVNKLGKFQYWLHKHWHIEMNTQILSCLNTKQFSLSSIGRNLCSLWSNNRIKWLITSHIEFVTTKKKLLMTHKIHRKSKAQTNLSPFRTDKHNYAITQSWLTTKNVTTATDFTTVCIWFAIDVWKIMCFVIHHLKSKNKPDAISIRLSSSS